MSRKWLSIVILVAVAGLLFGVNSCGRSQELVGIQVQPTSETFGASNIPLIFNAGAQIQLRALGTYIHPPVTKDITSQDIEHSADGDGEFRRRDHRDR